MLIKKITELQGFPTPEVPGKLLNTKNEFSENNLIFYDIETTGLSRSRNFVYLTGAASFEKSTWILHQWMCETPEDEPLLLREFSSFLEKASHTVQYNGKAFDQPFLENRYLKYGMDSPFKDMSFTDVYQQLLPLKSLLKLSHMRQTDLESLIKNPKRQYCGGGECIGLYRSYMKNHKKETEEILFGHNREDLLGLLSIMPLLSLTCFYDGRFESADAELSDEEVRFTLLLKAPVPVPISNGSEEFYISIKDNTAKILLPVRDGKIKQYFSDYRNYDYLPVEDTAIPKSLAKFMDRSLRIPTSKETCYTWVPVTEKFLSDPKQQSLYLRNTLPCLIDLL